jgi:hypothetical protein
MSISRVQRIGCACGHSFDALVFISINAERHPHLRQQLLDRNLHVFPCDACHTPFLVQTYLTYIDLARRQLLASFSEADRHDERPCGDLLMNTWRDLFQSGPPHLAAQADRFLVRACFGLEELREKIVLDEADLRDLPLEILKGELLRDDPWFAANRVVTLHLDHLRPDDGALVFWPSWLDKPAQTPWPYVVPRDAYDAIAAQGEHALLQARPGVAAGPFVNLLRVALHPARLTNTVQQLQQPGTRLHLASAGEPL